MTDPYKHKFAIHMNGTDRSDMDARFQDVLDKATELHSAMGHVLPNMRDYYTLDNAMEAFKTDRAEFEKNRQALVDLGVWATMALMRIRELEA
jgi:ribosomal protein S10